MLKRTLDICVSFLGLGILAIPFLLISLLIRLETPGSPIYWSKRIGRFGSVFMMPKFRTMKTGAPEMPSNDLVDPSSHITTFGRVLRKYSVDELPQLYSVLLGDMSLVGPRPMIQQQRDIYELRQQLGIHILRPGITGWAQINGRDDISVAQN